MQLSSGNNAEIHANPDNMELQQNEDPAQHTPLYPKLTRIGYVPDLELYQARLESSRRRLEAGGSVDALPKGWPQVLRGPLVWSRSELQSSNEWAYDLSNMDIQEIRSSLDYCKGK
jgi:hypothetical protein